MYIKIGFLLLLVYTSCLVNGVGWGVSQSCTYQLFLGFILGQSIDGDGFSFGSTSHCPSDFVKLKSGQCYLFSDVNFELNWHEARIDCLKRGGHLVIVNNKKENDCLKKYLMSNGGNKDYWIALNDIRTEGEFMWDSKPKPLSSKSFTDFMSNVNNTEEADCVFYNDPNYQWDIEECTGTKNYICERSPGSKFKCNSW